MAVQIGQEERRAAEKEDREHMLQMMSEMRSGLNGVGSAVDEVGSAVDENQGMIEENQQMLSLIFNELSELKKQSSAASPPPPGMALRFDPSEPWRINPKELEFEKEEDDFGEMVRVELGKGGFGTVFKGAFRGEAIAVKQIRLENKDVEPAFRKEVEIASKLLHRHIIMCYGGCILKKVAMLVTELMVGSLSDAIHKTKTVSTSDEKWRCSRQISRGLAYLHENGVVHRDVKPDNVMFDVRGVCKIIDFGLASTRGSSRASAAQSTMAGANAGSGSRPVDVYALSMTMYEIWFAVVPFGNKTQEQMFTISKQANPERPPLKASEDLPESVCRIISLGWRKSPSERPKMAEMAMMIENQEAPTAARKGDLEPRPAPGPAAVGSGSERTEEVPIATKVGPPVPLCLYCFRTPASPVLIPNFSDDDAFVVCDPADGSVYNGNWKDGLRSGLAGVFEFSNGDVYAGGWKDDLEEGMGTLTFVDGGSYEGYWSGGKKHGKGKVIFPDGKKFVGEFKDDERDGYGTLYKADGSVKKEGIWRMGKFQGGADKAVKVSSNVNKSPPGVLQKNVESAAVGSGSERVGKISGNIDEVEDFYRKALTIDPKNTDRLMNLAVLLQNHRKKFDEAEELYRKALAIDPKNIACLMKLAFLLINHRKKFDEAEELYRKALAIDSKNIACLMCLAILLKNHRKKFDEAEELYRKALAIDSKNTTCLMNLAILLQNHRKKFDEAEELYRKALAIDPKNTACLINLAILLKNHRKKFDEAEELYRKALAIDPKKTGVLMNLAILLQTHRKKFDEAEELYRKALAIDPKNTTCLINLAILLKNHRKKFDEAEELYRKALAIDPKNPLYLNNLACLLKNHRKKFDEAEAMFRKALAIDPKHTYDSKHTYSMISFGELLEDRHNKIDEAEGLYRKALTILSQASDPNTIYALCQLGLLLHRKQGKTFESWALFQRALKIALYEGGLEQIKDFCECTEEDRGGEIAGQAKALLQSQVEEVIPKEGATQDPISIWRNTLDDVKAGTVRAYTGLYIVLGSMIHLESPKLIKMTLDQIDVDGVFDKTTGGIDVLLYINLTENQFKNVITQLGFDNINDASLVKMNVQGKNEKPDQDTRQDFFQSINFKVRIGPQKKNLLWSIEHISRGRGKGSIIDELNGQKEQFEELGSLDQNKTD
eukprot:UC4_evm4s285